MSNFGRTSPSLRDIIDNDAADPMEMSGRTPERLVGYGFRCWLTGFETGDVTAWEDAWNSYRASLGADAAKPLILQLSQFVRAVSANADRSIEVYPPRCSGFCRDECLAISIIAACQHGQRTALCTCAAALLGSNDIGDALICAQNFAAGLKAADRMLCQSSVCAANCPLWAARPRVQ